MEGIRWQLRKDGTQWRTRIGIKENSPAGLKGSVVLIGKLGRTSLPATKKCPPPKPMTGILRMGAMRPGYLSDLSALAKVSIS